MEVTWFGHSNFRLEHNGVAFTIDPFFEGNPKAPFCWPFLGPVSIILVTHDHNDHVGQSVDIAKSRKIQLVGVYDTVNKLQNQGLPKKLGIGMNLGGKININGVHVNMVQALHSTASGVCAGYIITWPDGFCVYHSGDTTLFGDMELFAKFNNIKLAMLPIGGRFTMDSQQAAYACKLLSCELVAPMHWGTFPALEHNTSTFQKHLMNYAPKTKVLNLVPGTPIII